MPILGDILNYLTFKNFSQRKEPASTTNTGYIDRVVRSSTNFEFAAFSLYSLAKIQSMPFNGSNYGHFRKNSAMVTSQRFGSFEFDLQNFKFCGSKLCHTWMWKVHTKSTVEKIFWTKQRITPA